jgi:YfiR/HmsC-like
MIEQAIKRTVEGEFVQGRPLVMMQPHTPKEAETCQILYVGRSEQERATSLLAAVRDRPVLTVGDSPLFVDSGGAIQFVLVENRVRFDVNLTSAQRANLKISANLLRVARKVEPKK